MKAPKTILCLCCLLLASFPLKAQTLFSYSFDTGVDSTKWVTLTQPVLLQDYSTPSYTNSSIVNFFDPVQIMDHYFSHCSVHRSGRMMMGSNLTNDYDFSTIRMSQWNRGNSYLMPYGVVDTWDSCSSIVYQIIGGPDNRMLVCQFSLMVDTLFSGDSANLSRFQVQLELNTGVIRYVYAPRPDSLPEVVGQIGIAQSRYKYISIRPDLHTAAENDDYEPFPLPWPGAWRYYEFTPHFPCGRINSVGVTNARLNTATVTISNYWYQRYRYYLVEYDTAGFIDGTGHQLTTTLDTVSLSGLQPSTRYEVRVRGVCYSGDTSETTECSFTTYQGSCTNIPFTYLYPPFAECMIGSYNTNRQQTTVDYGPESAFSRHTVHNDTSERDPRTNFLLRTVPQGHCSSVRLGNWRIGGEEESITYNLHVDTLDYDLLVLRYALVEENPNHTPANNPHFILSFRDSADNLLDSCYYADFVSSDSSGWRRVSNVSSIVVWRNWSAVGLNLTPFHGQNIRISLYNSDCGVGGHYGYAYFTLEGAFKHLSATTCGDDVENTFHAPQGFAYRWYNADAPSVTLSTVDSLHVTTAGQYNCELTYLLPGRNCSVTLSSWAGTRYPVARFSMASLDSCGATRRFVNQSVVATDSARTQLTSEPCHHYLWFFDDGTSDTLPNPIHTFSPGEHSVTLMAMLSNGACAHTTTQTFVVDPYWTETRHDTVCHGQGIRYGDTLFTAEGIHFLDIDSTSPSCPVFHYLDLTLFPIYHDTLSDTIPEVSVVTIHDQPLQVPGVHTLRFSSVHGCDSLVTYRLSTLRSVDTTVCLSALPVVWDGLRFTGEATLRRSLLSSVGTDSLIDYTLRVRPDAALSLSTDIGCDPVPHHRVLLGAPYHYGWRATPSDTALVDTLPDASCLLHIAPQSPVRYHFSAEWDDTPHCPVYDSLLFEPLGEYRLDMKLHSDHLTPDHPMLHAFETGENLAFRHWYVDDLLLPDTGRYIDYLASPYDDSLTVTLVGGRSVCADTLSHVAYIHREANLWFPNLFTPGEADNNLFRATAFNITDYELWIFDRNGLFVFHTTDLNQGWDGTHHGTPCQQETFVYKCRYRRLNDPDWYTLVGTVLLLR